MSNLMAMLLQSLSARLGIVTGMDLAQACRAMFDRRVSRVLWVLCEVAIAACDLAEVLGSAIGLKLLFGIPLLAGVLITAFDTLLLLVLQSPRHPHDGGVHRRPDRDDRRAAWRSRSCCPSPTWGAIAGGFVPSLPGAGALYLAIGILGATVMPHNLYLHSALVQSRRITHDAGRHPQRASASTSSTRVVALNGAFFVNAALLVMAAATFFRAGHPRRRRDPGRPPPARSRSWAPPIAPIAFAVALIASGQSSTITGTLAGQIVMEGFVQIRLRPVVRRLLTRAARDHARRCSIIVCVRRAAPPGTSSCCRRSCSRCSSRSR